MTKFKFKFKVYYQFDGPTIDRPAATEKNKEEVDDSLDRVKNELDGIIDDSTTVISVEILSVEEKTRLLKVVSSLSKADIMNAIERTLNGLELYCEEI